MSTATAIRQPSFASPVSIRQRQQPATVPPVRISTERISDDKLCRRVDAYLKTLGSIEANRLEAETTAAGEIERAIQAAAGGEIVELKTIRDAIAKRTNSEFAFLVKELGLIASAKKLAVDLQQFASDNLSESERQKKSMAETVRRQLNDAGLGLESQPGFPHNIEAAKIQFESQVNRSEQTRAATEHVAEANQLVEYVHTFTRRLDERKAAIVAAMRELVRGLPA